MIRFAEQRDLPAIYSLWETCFPDEGGFNGYFFSHLYEPAHTLLLMQGEYPVRDAPDAPVYTFGQRRAARDHLYLWRMHASCLPPPWLCRELLTGSFALDKEKKRARDTHSGRKMAVEFYSSVWLYRDILSLAPLTDANSRGVRTAAPYQRCAHPADQRTLRSLVPAASYHARP